MDLNRSRKINIALGFDENYLVPIYALLTSIFHNNKDNGLAFHFIATGLNEVQTSNLNEYINKNGAQVFYYKIELDSLKEKLLVPENAYYTVATYYKLFFPTLVPQSIDRLLYIDSDTIVLGNLCHLYDLDLKAAPFAAAIDTYSEIRNDLGIEKHDGYFNAGVLLIDLKSWKDQKITEKALQFINDYPEKIKVVDQDALNAVSVNRWHVLDQKYNMTRGNVKLQIPSKKLEATSIIVHYTTGEKPWHSLARNKLRYLYHYYLKLSPCSSEKKYTDFTWQLPTLKRFLSIRLKEFYFDKGIDKIIPIKKLMQSTTNY